MTNILKHATDDADLSFIATDNGLIVACGQNHVWRIPLDAQAIPADTAALREAVQNSPLTQTLLTTEGIL